MAAKSKNNGDQKSAKKTGLIATLFLILIIFLTALIPAAVLVEMFIAEEGASYIIALKAAIIVFPILIIYLLFKYKATLQQNIDEMEEDGPGGAIGGEEKELYKNYLTNNSIGLFSFGSGGKFKYVSGSFHKLFGYSNKGEILKSNFFTFFPNDTDGKETLKNLVRQKGKVKNYKTKLNKKGGTKIIANINLDFIEDEISKESYYEGWIEDITQEFIKENDLKKEIAELRKEKEQHVQTILQTKNSSSVKAQTLANMSHEIKTPVSSVLGFLNLIEKGMFGSVTELKEFAANTRIAVDSLFDIVTNVLDISKFEAGKLELDHVQFNFHSEVSKAKSIVTPKALEKGLELNFNVSDKIPKSTYGDPTRLRQIFVNLLTNSVKNTASGEVSLNADVISSSMDSVKIKVSVTDTGKGIPADKLKLLFKPYTQLKNKGEEKEGTGLGLMITKQFVEMMGGRIEVHSDEGVGTTVEFTALIDLNPTKTATIQSKPGAIENNAPVQQTIPPKAAEPEPQIQPPVAQEPPVQETVNTINEIPMEDSVPQEEPQMNDQIFMDDEIKMDDEIPAQPEMPVEEPVEENIPINNDTPAEISLKDLDDVIDDDIDMQTGNNLDMQGDAPTEEPPKRRKVRSLDDALKPVLLRKPGKGTQPDSFDTIEEPPAPDPTPEPVIEPPVPPEPVVEPEPEQMENSIPENVFDNDEIPSPVGDAIPDEIPEPEETPEPMNKTSQEEEPVAKNMSPKKEETKIEDIIELENGIQISEGPGGEELVIEDISNSDDTPLVDQLPEVDDLPDLNLNFSKPLKSNGKRILLVEDNPISQKVETKILLEFGYEVVTVSNGKEAIKAVEMQEFDIILMDLQMPDMDGIAATKKIRSLPAPMNHVPIIAVTAHSSMKDREMCLDSGMDDYIAKPININFLRMTIEQWINRSH